MIEKTGLKEHKVPRSYSDANESASSLTETRDDGVLVLINTGATNKIHRIDSIIPPNYHLA